jgi:hypothetical protein
MSDIPAGWKPDPRGRHEYRYWDGTQWTDHVSDQGEVSQDPVADTGSDIADVEKSGVFAPSGVQQAPPTGESTPPPTAEQPAATEPAAETTPEPVVSEPAPTAATTAASAGPPTSSAAPSAGTAPTTPETTTNVPSSAQTEAKAAAQEVIHGKSPELGTILTAVVPGSGHFYMGSQNTSVAAGLLVATVAALVLSWVNFPLFIVGFVLWAAAAAYGLKDLRGGVRGIEDTALPKNVVAILLIAAGALLVISLLLPWYTGDAGSVSGFDVLDVIDLILLVIGAASILAGAAALGLGPVSPGELPRWMPTAVAIGGAVAAVLILFRMFVVPEGGDSSIGRGFGIWFGFWAALVLVVANAGVLRSLAADRS